MTEVVHHVSNVTPGISFSESAIKHLLSYLAKNEVVCEKNRMFGFIIRS